jgi:ACS family tartrate transporter-like MFS transporter
MNDDAIFRKCAWRLVPLILLLYLANRIDRVNVGFAALTMNMDLGFSPSVFGFGAGVFFLSYAPFQVPANLILQRVGARRWVFLITLAWGAISAATAFVHTPAGFYAVRFLLGLAEAGFFPGVIFYLTLWFPHVYRARLIAAFFTASPLAPIIAGPLSSVILQMDGFAGLYGWQWLFVIEALPSFVLAFAAMKFLPDNPARAPFLSEAEKASVLARLTTEESGRQHDLWRALRDPRVLVCGLIYLGFELGNAGIVFWLPQIVQGMGFSNFATGFVVVLPNLAAVAAMLLWSRSSDAKGERIWHLAAAFALGAAGFVLAGLAPSDAIVFAGLTLAWLGLQSAFAVLFSLPSAFLSGTAAAGGIALVSSIGITGGFFGPTIMGLLKQYTGGYSAGMMVLALGSLMSLSLVLALGRAMAPRAVALPAKIGGEE